VNEKLIFLYCKLWKAGWERGYCRYLSQINSFSTVSLPLQQDSVHVPVSQRITRALSY